MTKVNFKTIPFRDIEDKEQLFDCQKEIGNAIYMQAANIEERDLGRMIYYATGEVELTDQQVEWIKNTIAPDFDLIPSPSIVKTELANAFIRLTNEQSVLLDYIEERATAEL